MNFSLLERIARADRGILVTVLDTEGHTYKKRGEKALYVTGSPLPVSGNLGSLCMAKDIVTYGEAAWKNGRPGIARIDTSDPADAHFGYGTSCGGVMTLLIEPILDRHKKTYAKLRRRLEARRDVHLLHDLATGDLSLSSSPPAGATAWTPSRPAGPNALTSAGGLFAEHFAPAPELAIFGATPLAREVIHDLSGTRFRIHVTDWREDYLNTLADLPAVALHPGTYPVGRHTFALILSHSYEHDREALRQALAAGCAYVGLLSSRTRRDRMYAQLEADGVPRAALDRVSSPVGLDIGARTDPEIAVSIVAEMVRFLNR